jgi:hypothetical protein
MIQYKPYADSPRRICWLSSLGKKAQNSADTKTTQSVTTLIVSHRGRNLRQQYSAFTTTIAQFCRLFPKADNHLVLMRGRQMSSYIETS